MDEEDEPSQNKKEKTDKNKIIEEPPKQPEWVGLKGHVGLGAKFLCYC